MRRCLLGNPPSMAPANTETNNKQNEEEHGNPMRENAPFVFRSLCSLPREEGDVVRGLTAPPYAVAVIGLGMIGSAATRHLTMAMAGLSIPGRGVVGIGPAEPTGPWGSYEGPFAAHYDEGRLTRISDPSPVWACLAARSIARYGELEKESGIAFHYAVGSVRVDSSVDELWPALEAGRLHGAVQETMDGAVQMRAAFPYFGSQEPLGQAALVESGAAGYINPRRMVAAQLAMAERGGARVIREAVREIETEAERGGGAVRIVTEMGRAVWAKKVLVCAGSHTGFLLGPNRFGGLDLRTYGRTVVMAELEGEEEAERLAGMPSFIWRLPDNPVLSWAYGCPPTRYPDGRMVLKLGGTEHAPTELSSSRADLDAWFSRPARPNPESSALVDVLLARLLPGLRVRNLSTKPCAVSFTAHGLPYIDTVDESGRVLVAAGGCGAAAKSSDEIGRLASLLCLGRWPSSELDPQLFRAVFVVPADKKSAPPPIQHNQCSGSAGRYSRGQESDGLLVTHGPGENSRTLRS